MSREFYDAVQSMHEDNAARFSENDDGVRREVKCRISDRIYVYLFENGVHIQTQRVDPPESWWDNWPSDATVKRYVRRMATIGNVRITNLNV